LYSLDVAKNKNGSVGVVSEPVVTGTGIVVDFEEQIGGRWDVDILLGGNVPNYREVAIYSVSESRIGDMRLHDNGNAFRGPNMGVAFSIWVDGDRSSILWSDRMALGRNESQ
jgi:hypothetical protein